LPASISVYLAWRFASTSKNLAIQLTQVQLLSEKNHQQELEKQHILETQNEELEKEVIARTSELRNEKQRSDDLIRNILPDEIAEELKLKGATQAKLFDHVSVLFTDFVDFTKAGERLSPQQLVDELHTCFKAFDEIISKYSIEKIKTIGDAYLAVSGLPLADESHAVKITRAAIEIREFIRLRKEQYPDRSFNIRIGIHSGSAVAGIVGVKKFAYDIWGDAVNTAARMEQSSETGKINIFQSTWELIKDKFNCTHRGEITAKNKGPLNMYFVENEIL
jgi:adenylate cyclase